MRKLGTWGGTLLATLALVVGVAGVSVGQTSTRERAVPWLGVSTQSLDQDLREGIDYRGDGVLVSSVVDGSPAERAGIRKGDVIVSVNSQKVESPRELSDVIQGSRVGQSVAVALVRDGQRRSVSARLGERPEDGDMPDMDELRDLPQRIGRDMEKMPQVQGEGGDNFVFRAMGRGRLGVRVDDLNADLGSYFDVPDGRGALVLEVLKDTPAEHAGLKAGDVLIEVGDRKISGSDDLVEALRDADAGKVSLTVLRKGARRTLQAELEDAPNSYRFGPGSHQMVMRPRNGRTAIPEVRREVRRDSDENGDDIQELRDQIRELQQKLDKLEGDRN